MIKSANSHDIEIRIYRDTDKQGIVELVRELQTHEGAYFDRMKPPGEISSWYVDDLNTECAEAKGKLIVACSDGLPVGYAQLLTDQTSESERDEINYTYALVGELIVTKKFQRKGIGTRLIAECEKLAQ